MKTKMTSEEIQQLRKGDIIYIPFVVGEVEERSVSCYLPRTEDNYYFTDEDIESWERPRRKFRKGDIVVTNTKILGFVLEDENEFGVLLDFGSDHRKAKDLTLVMTAEEYAERMGKKGGKE